MSSKLGIDKSTQAMLCPCCGTTILRSEKQCRCGATFVGEPLDQTPLNVQRLGPAMTSVALLLLAVSACLLFTKWLAFAVVVVIWSAWRAVRLARRNPQWYGGYKTAAATLVVTSLAGAILAAYGIGRIPQAWENYKLRQTAFTQSEMHHVAALLEEYKRTSGAYPKDAQEYRKLIGESLPADYWERTIKYQGKIGDLAERRESIQSTVLSHNNFELRSAGPDGVLGTDDDIVMRDGFVFTNSDIKRQPLAQQAR